MLRRVLDMIEAAPYGLGLFFLLPMDSDGSSNNFISYFIRVIFYLSVLSVLCGERIQAAAPWNPTESARTPSDDPERRSEDPPGKNAGCIGPH